MPLANLTRGPRWGVLETPNCGRPARDARGCPSFVPRRGRYNGPVHVKRVCPRVPSDIAYLPRGRPASIRRIARASTARSTCSSSTMDGVPSPSLRSLPAALRIVTPTSSAPSGRNAYSTSRAPATKLRVIRNASRTSLTPPGRRRLRTCVDRKVSCLPGRPPHCCVDPSRTPGHSPLDRVARLVAGLGPRNWEWRLLAG